MRQYEKRVYRKRIAATGLVSFHVAVKETDLWVGADVMLEQETRDLVLEQRRHLETYIKAHPDFMTTLLPWDDDPYAPDIVKEMVEMSRRAGVGPMAAVAGAIAQHVGNGLLKFSRQAIVENGGDIFLHALRPVTVSIFAGTSPLSEKLGLFIPVNQMPVGVCASSGTVGHSLSLGKADAVCLVSPSAALADAAATALGNRVKNYSDLQKAAAFAQHVEGILGGVIILRERMTAWGDIELVDL